MACSANQLLVSGIESYPNANGVYTALDPVEFASYIASYNSPGLKMWGRIVGTEAFMIDIGRNPDIMTWSLSYFQGIPEGEADWNIIETYYEDGLGFSGLELGYIYPDDQDVCPLIMTWSDVADASATISIYSGAPSQPTFGLPADVVALITSRFGTVANFLRLRNQGQV